jgi:thiamine pyrophosphokinase
MEDNINTIDFTFLDQAEKQYDYTVLIILNRPIHKDQYKDLKDKVDYIICADGAANRMYDNLGTEGYKLINTSEENIPNCIVGDFDSIRPEVQEHYNGKNVKLLHRIDQETTDLEKCLYVSLEKIGEFSCNINEENKRYAIIILGSAGGRIDHTFAAYSQVYKYINNYQYELGPIEIFLISQSSVSVYLKHGLNKIVSCKNFRNKENGYSIIPLFGEINVAIREIEEDYTFSNKII